MSGFTNKVIYKKDIVHKTSQDITSVYLDKTNEYLFLNELKKINTDILVKPINVIFDGNTLISTFPFIKSHIDLTDTKINKLIVELVAEGIVELRKIKIEGLKKFSHINYLEWFLKNIKNPIHKINMDITSFSILDKQDYVLSHNDLVPGNILFNGVNDVKLIDYDFTKYNNRYFDIASFITETLNDDSTLVNYFIKVCKEKKLFDNFEILNLEIKYQDILWSLWANYMFDITGTTLFKDICIDKYNRFLNRTTYK
ncbi:choline kinase [Spiroplasma sp. TIUS-1]|uniref:phosphotransferase n=1 Tax=Spiroplasma sp. TIUS-1 TaxID=216963 RepID=UPI00139969F5|nr:phosphotransferase [Spiroplasma sp. TIUS-1]QHX35883.1 choline kinase [Spiroplasma sp. TIUS-1]